MKIREEGGKNVNIRKTSQARDGFEDEERREARNVVDL